MVPKKLNCISLELLNCLLYNKGEYFDVFEDKEIHTGRLLYLMTSMINEFLYYSV